MILEKKKTTTVFAVREYETTDYTDFTDGKRVMKFTNLKSLEYDGLQSSFPRNPLQSVKSVVKKGRDNPFHLPFQYKLWFIHPPYKLGIFRNSRPTFFHCAAY